MKPPRILALCELCPDEVNCHSLGEVAYDGSQWLCVDCYGAFDEPATKLIEAPFAKQFVTVTGTAALAQGGEE